MVDDTSNAWHRGYHAGEDKGRAILADPNLFHGLALQGAVESALTEAEDADRSGASNLRGEWRPQVIDRVLDTRDYRWGVYRGLQTVADEYEACQIAGGVR